MRKRYFIGNLKMNLLSREEVEQYLLVLRREATGKHFGNVTGVICPPIIYSREFDHVPAPFQKGAQNVFWEREGAFTGEISPLMLKNDRCDFVIIGHSNALWERNECRGVRKSARL